MKYCPSGLVQYQGGAVSRGSNVQFEVDQPVFQLLVRDVVIRRNPPETATLVKPDSFVLPLARDEPNEMRIRSTRVRDCLVSQSATNAYSAILRVNEHPLHLADAWPDVLQRDAPCGLPHRVIDQQASGWRRVFSWQSCKFLLIHIAAEISVDRRYIVHVATPEPRSESSHKRADFVQFRELTCLRYDYQMPVLSRLPDQSTING